MDVVIRGIMASALGVYAAMHASQVASGPEGAPAWVTFAFGATAVVAVLLAVALIAAPERLQRMVDAAAAALVGGSLIALIMSYTVGFFGVTQAEVRIETALVLVAEVIALTAFGLALRFGDQSELQEVPTKQSRDPRLQSVA